MPGNKIGGMKAAATNKERHGEDFYKKLGVMGGKSSSNGGFGSKKTGKDGLTGIQRAKKAGKIGGTVSKPYAAMARKKAREQAREQDTFFAPEVGGFEAVKEEIERPRKVQGLLRKFGLKV